MNIEFRESFLKDLRAIKDKKLLRQIRDTIQALESTATLFEVPNLRKLRGAKKYYRIRIGDHRLGLVVEGDSLVLTRLLNRKDIYRYFP